jgi:hypothetical protein
MTTTSSLMSRDRSSSEQPGPRGPNEERGMEKHMDFGGRKARANMDYAKTPMEKLARAHEGEE